MIEGGEQFGVLSQGLENPKGGNGKRVLLAILQILLLPVLFLVSWILILLPLSVLTPDMGAGGLAVVIVLFPAMCVLTYILERILGAFLAKKWVIKQSVLVEALIVTVLILPVVYILATLSLVWLTLGVVIFGFVIMAGRWRSPELRMNGLKVMGIMLLLVLVMVGAMIGFLKEKYNSDKEMKKLVFKNESEALASAYKIEDIYLAPSTTHSDSGVEYEAVVKIYSPDSVRGNLIINVCNKTELTVIEKLMSAISREKERSGCVSGSKAHVLKTALSSGVVMLEPGENTVRVGITWEDEAAETSGVIDLNASYTAILLLVKTDKMSGGSTLVTTPEVDRKTGLVRIETAPTPTTTK